MFLTTTVNISETDFGALIYFVLNSCAFLDVDSNKPLSSFSTLITSSKPVTPACIILFIVLSTHLV